MNEEEKKAIKEVNHFKELTRYWQEEEYEEKEIAGYIETILNLIEKQSKEIEELKNADLTTVYLNGFYDGEKKVKDKIKAKIEELENQKRQWIEDRDNKHKDSEIIYAIEVLQELLEESEK